MLPSKAICSGSVATGLSEPGATLQLMQLNAALGDLARSQKVAEPAADRMLALSGLYAISGPFGFWKRYYQNQGQRLRVLAFSCRHS